MLNLCEIVDPNVFPFEAVILSLFRSYFWASLRIHCNIVLCCHVPDSYRLVVLPVFVLYQTELEAWLWYRPCLPNVLHFFVSSSRPDRILSCNCLGLHFLMSPPPPRRLIRFVCFCNSYAVNRTQALHVNNDSSLFSTWLLLVQVMIGIEIVVSGVGCTSQRDVISALHCRAALPRARVFVIRLLAGCCNIQLLRELHVTGREFSVYALRCV